MNEWQDSTEKDEAIVKFEATPKGDDEGKLTRRETLSFSTLIGRLLAKKLREAAELGEEYARAKVAQEKNTAVKIAEDAAESASRREESEAKAKLLDEQAVGQLIKNLKNTEELTPENQALAMAKILDENPEIIAQLGVVLEMRNTLRAMHGLDVEIPQPAPALLTDESESAESE